MTKSLGNCESRSNGYSTEGEKMYNSPVSRDSDENDVTITYSRIEKKSKKTIKTKSKSRFYSSISSADSDYTRILFSSPTSDSSCSSSHPSNTITEEHFNSRQRMMQQKHIGSRRFKRFSSKERNNDEVTVPLRESAENKQISERLVPHIVVKGSGDPYRDFKRSMLEMTVRKMSDPREMENLLMSFLPIQDRIINSTQKLYLEKIELWITEPVMELRMQ